MKRKEGFFKGFDGVKLFFQEWLQDQPARGLLVITHGQGEHSDSYLRFVDGIKKSGWSIIAWDWRGHGRSDGKRGYAHDFSDYVKDYHVFLNLVLKMPEFEKLPIVLLGHSMGGLIQVDYLTQEFTKDTSTLSDRIKAQILSSPLLGLSVEVPQIKDFAARAAFKIYPQLTMHNELNDKQFSRDPDVLKSYPKDPLRHNKISPGVYLGFLREFEIVHKNANHLSLPTLMQLSEKDSVVSTPSSEKYFEALGAAIKKKFVYKDRLHESYNDLGREEVYADFMDFIKPF